MEIFIVGGFVRDTILGLQPKDKDFVVVNASPSDIQQMIDEGFQQVGADFPVFLHPVTGDEYALARVERKIGVGYKGFETYTNQVSLKEDLSRRDLTINAMALDPNTNQIFDPFGGMSDLKSGVLRHVSDAFAEDPLRVLRVARFAARYDFRVAENTLNLMKQIVGSGELDHLSKERIWVELEKILSEKNSLIGLQILEDIGAFKSIFGISPKNDGMRVRQVMMHDAVNNVKFEQLDVMNKFIALAHPFNFSKNDFSKMRIPLHVQNGFIMFNNIVSTFDVFDLLDAETKVKFIKQIDALGETTTFADIQGVLNWETMNVALVSTLDDAIVKIKSVECSNIAAQFKNGKDIADAIFNARVTSLS